ncbi:unnamed protein product [Microthlaspi erraticum]|uniref:X8 domain-containing protein n=1 Tax=Microthlaspi erraticum TaxID=1685480 RepID=A0A6D2I3T0_9BRAS|nr:unnamed protein product [Microthlaspi erraticum]
MFSPLRLLFLLLLVAVINRSPVANSTLRTLSHIQWCVAAPGASDAVLQAKIDWICQQVPKVNCKPIESGGACFEPNTVHSHASDKLYCKLWKLAPYASVSEYSLHCESLYPRDHKLPLMESQLGMTKIKKVIDRGMHLRSPVFWIDEETKDYIVLWGIIGYWVVYSKKGDDNLWKQIPKTSSCYHMVYVDHKLYFLTECGGFCIFDFSGGFPQEIFVSSLPVERFETRLRNILYATKIVVRVTGEVLMVEKFLKKRSETWFFKVYKVSPPRLPKKKKVIDSLGDEVMLFDQGITVLANDVDGLVRDSIYFSSSHKNTHELFLFDLKTRKTELLHEFDSSSIPFSRGRWFSPRFTHRLC